jgi:hypothetical protein
MGTEFHFVRKDLNHKYFEKRNLKFTDTCCIRDINTSPIHAVSCSYIPPFSFSFLSLSLRVLLTQSVYTTACSFDLHDGPKGVVTCSETSISSTLQIFMHKLIKRQLSITILFICSHILPSLTISVFINIVFSVIVGV